MGEQMAMPIAEVFGVTVVCTKSSGGDHLCRVFQPICRGSRDSYDVSNYIGRLMESVTKAAKFFVFGSNNWSICHVH
jgi:hypothetical protein